MSRENQKDYGLVGRRMLRGGTYGEVDALAAADKLSSNPLDHWTQAYLRFTRFEGGDKIRAAMGTILSTTGVVAALISTLVVAALISPPLCTGDILNVNSGCDGKQATFTLYGALHIVNLVNCLSTITYVTIAALWLGVHRDQEMTYFIVEYYIYAIAIPATCMSFAIVGTFAAELIRVWVIYGQIAFYIGIGFAACLMAPCCWFATKVVFTTVALRRAHSAYQTTAMKSLGESP